jgi:aminoglycoside phosphotransferase (APT) family kinase protein
MSEASGLAAELVPVDALRQWMDDAGLPGEGGLPLVSKISGGTQNLVFEVRRGGKRVVLRRPPHQPPPGRGAIMLREHALLSALAGTDVPHPRALGVCADPSVIGEPFYVMEFVEGWSPASVDVWPEPYARGQAARREMGFQIVDAIARLAKVDYKAVGLDQLGHPDGFHERQVDRWLHHFDAFRFREVPGLDVTANWLRAHRPRTFTPGIMHGDFQIANLMFSSGDDVRVAAIVDWEMATIGDPLLDLAWFLMTRRADGDPPHKFVYADFEGLPSDDEMIAHYISVSGLEVDGLDYYAILARFKMAIVLEGGYARYCRGEAWNERLQTFGEVVLDLARKSAELAGSSTMPANQ